LITFYSKLLAMPICWFLWNCR